MKRPCSDPSDYPTLHTCDDPATCAVDSLIAGPNYDGGENAMRDLIDEVRQVIAEPRFRRTKLADAIAKLVES